MVQMLHCCGCGIGRQLQLQLDLQPANLYMLQVHTYKDERQKRKKKKQTNKEKKKEVSSRLDSLCILWNTSIYPGDKKPKDGCHGSLQTLTLS